MCGNFPHLLCRMACHTWGHCLRVMRFAANAETKGHKNIRTKELQDIRAWTCVHVPSRTEGLRRYDFERHKQRNYSIKRYGVALMSLEATRTIVRGRQPRSGLVCILCKLMFLCFRGKRQARTSYLMSLCPYVLMFPALAAAKPRYEPINTFPRYNHLTERCKFRPFLPRLRSRR